MSDTPIYVESRNSVDHVRLPYQLTTGVTATREGLEIDTEQCAVYQYFDDDGVVVRGDLVTYGWYMAAERLRYREGEPWCSIYTSHNDRALICGDYLTTNIIYPASKYLHRIAAILCDDAEAFRVLHWCVNNLKGDS